MPPKQRFNQDLILNQAYRMFQDGGMDAVNARSVSKALHCSTQPIFSYFPDMSGLRTALVDRAYEDFSACMGEAEKENASILSRCLAFEHFAAENPMIFLFLIGNDPRNRDENACDILFALPDTILRAEMERLNLKEDAARQLAREVSVYASGAAVLLALGNGGADPEALAKGTESVYDMLIAKLGA